MPLLTLRNEDARIVALAVAYHLGRPGSETDPDTLQPHALGLGRVYATLVPQLDRAEVAFELTSYRSPRLDEALRAAVKELKQYELSHRRSAVPGFEEALARLFPELAPALDPARAANAASSADAPTALDLVERVVAL